MRHHLARIGLAAIVVAATACTTLPESNSGDSARFVADSLPAPDSTASDTTIAQAGNTDTAADFYRRYSGDPGAIPLPACATGSTDLSEREIQEVLLEHNRARKDADRHVPNGLPPLPAVDWDCAAAEVAQLWADESEGTEGHSSNQWRQQQYADRTGLSGGAAKIGENLAWATGNARSAPSLASRVTAWDDEREDYNYETQACNGVCGHYTQIVWRESTSIGCGVHRGEVSWPGSGGVYGGFFLSCTYHNAGNFNGDPPLEVHPDWYYN